MRPRLKLTALLCATATLVYADESSSTDCFALLNAERYAQAMIVVDQVIKGEIDVAEGEVWLRALMPSQCEDTPDNAPALRAAAYRRWQAQQAGSTTTTPE
jgi:hypothetical protein